MTTQVEMWIDGFDEPFILRKPNIPQMSILRETSHVDGNLDEARLLVGAIALFVGTASKPKMTLQEASLFCVEHFDAAVKLWARVSEML